ncbi:transcription factor TGA4-like isoform X1 [Punica granatum]|uniref:Transcription factor TGA4-like isoform X1 n=1 Tax=Punica granatum TaxID=22663 RepID=A0A6P8DWI0_PUNGR|nr:transcription factor TGA4-like isoform X1 [Punica granatum]XP_031396648.1 transcription factor TGA4-like isoform X1 [Punica granatum]XP_031396649.1 transcription factor TGA4-like isoform X1 [Punica granatum]
MNPPSAQFVLPRRMGMYEPFHQIGTWAQNLKATDDSVASASLIVEVDTKLDNQSEDTSHGTLGTPNKYDQEASKPFDKIQRRLAQNREAARKSRLRKKAYVQQLETSRLKLIQIEKELDRARQQVCLFIIHPSFHSASPQNSKLVNALLQGVYTGGGAESSHLGFSGSVNTGITAFEMEYGHWVEEQDRQILDLRTALQAHISDAELRILVQNGMNHYSTLFHMKANAAKADVFYVMSGMWKTSSERFFLWIGGFRPSELLKVLVPQLDTLTDHQLFEICNLRQSCQQAEDALSQGMERLQQTVSETVSGGRLGEGSNIAQIAPAVEQLEALISFVKQADHIRKETLNQMPRILTIRQTARGLLALGEYFQRLRALSSLWSDRPCETT